MEIGVLISSPSYVTYGVTPGKSLPFSVLWFPYLENGALVPDAPTTRLFPFLPLPTLTPQRSEAGK